MFSFDKIFSIKKDQLFTRVKIFGIKLFFVSSKVKNLRKSQKVFYKNQTSITRIPKAQGTLRDIQIADLYILRELDKIFERDKLTYWIDFGTLLGAIRHKGFIPWDDDIDISMPRNDYEKFIKTYITDAKPLHKDLKCIFCVKKSNMCFVKIKLTGISAIDVDIFPYDNYYKIASEKEKIQIKKAIDKIIKPKRAKIKNPEEFRQKIKEEVFTKILKGNNQTVENPTLFYAPDYPHRWKNWIFDYETIYPIRKIEFEGLQFCAPNDCDKVLKSIFGDYMKLPKDTFPKHMGNYEYSAKEQKRINELKTLIKID